MDFAQLLALIPVLAQQAPGGNPGGGLGMLLPMILMIAAFWFLLIAPQRKKQKEHQKLLKTLKKDDKVMTAGGIYGTILHVKEDRVSMRVDTDVKLEINLQSIQNVLNRDSADGAKK